MTASCLLSGLNAVNINPALRTAGGVVAAQQPVGGGVVEVHPVLIVRGGDPAAVATDVQDLQVAAFGRRRTDQRGTLGQRGHQVRPGLRRVVQPRARGREQQREADVVGELGPGADPPRVCGDGQLFRLCRVLFRLCGVLVRSVGLDGSQDPGDQGEDEEYGGAAQHDPEPPDQPGLRACSLGRALLLGVGVAARGGSRNSRSIVGQGGVRAGAASPARWPAGRRGRARCRGGRGCPRRRRRPRGGAGSVGPRRRRRASRAAAARPGRGPRG